MRRCFALVCLGVVSCANPDPPKVDGFPEDPGHTPQPPLPVGPAHPPGPGFSTDDSDASSAPNEDTAHYPSYDAGALPDAGDAGSETLDTSTFSETSGQSSTDPDGGAVNERDAGD
jgi:hypothetical protein